MAVLSISRAWDETKARIAADGRLLAVVAAALFVLPSLVTGVISPETSAGGRSVTEGIIILIASLIAVIGQLAIIRLSIGPAVSVGEAIAHGARRMPIYFVAGVLILLGLAVAAIPFVVILVAAGVPMEREAIAHSPVAAILSLLYFIVLVFIGIRMLMSSPVASEEPVAPVAIIRRSWALTAGHWWRLFGFLVLFMIGALIAIAAINWAVGFVAITFLGPIDPMSASALLVAFVDALVNAVVTVFLAVFLARIYVQLAGGEAASVPSSGT